MLRPAAPLLVLLAAGAVAAQPAPEPVAPAAPPQPPAGPGAQPAPAPPAAHPPPYPYGYPYPQAPVFPQAEPRPLPAELPYDPARPVPPGYVVEERVRRGAVIAGAIIAGVPYAIGLQVAMASGFENDSHWLLVPGVGPFLMMGARDEKCDGRESSGGGGVGECIGEGLLVMALVADGLLQTAGGVVLAVGLTAKKKVLVRQRARLELAPVRVGTGHGLGLRGSF